MECMKCGYKGKPEWGNFKRGDFPIHVRCAKCKSTDHVCFTGLDRAEHEIRYPSFCYGMEGRKHPKTQNTVLVTKNSYSITCPLCFWGMTAGGADFEPEEVQRLHKMMKKGVERIENTYYWERITTLLGWTWKGETDFEIVAGALSRTKVDLQDLAVIFFTKLARWSSEALENRIEKSFKEWVENLHNEAQKEYEILADDDKEAIQELVKQMKDIIKNQR